MTWGEWKLVLDVLETFVSQWGHRVLNFNVVDASQPGVVSKGRGYLEDNLESVADNGVQQS